MTPTELMNATFDPKQILELQRMGALATFDALLDAQKEGRKLADEVNKHTPDTVADWMKPYREATDELNTAGHDLLRRSLQAGRRETDRWFGVFLPAEG